MQMPGRTYKQIKVRKLWDEVIVTELVSSLLILY